MAAWLIILALVLIVLSLLVYYHNHQMSYLERIDVIHEKPWPIVGNLGPFMLRKLSLSHIIELAYNQNREAKYVGFYDFLDPVILIRDPELMKQIAIKNFDSFVDHRGFLNHEDEPLMAKNLFNLRGDKWRTMRTILSPAFTASKMKLMFKLMLDCGESCADFLSKNSCDGQMIDAKDLFTRFCNDTIATCAFGISVDSMRNRDNLFYTYGREATNLSSWKMALKIFFKKNFPTLFQVLGIRVLNEKITRFFTEAVESTIRMRKEGNIYRPDMLQLMVESAEKDETYNWTAEELTSQAFVFFFAGFETSANLMCLTSHIITTHPEVQEKLQAEIDKALEENNGELTYDMLNSLVYLDAVISETHRMYPLAVFLDRVCVKPFELPPALPGKAPVLLKPGSVVWFTPVGFQRDPKYFDDPTAFKPERFLDHDKVDGMTYAPFGLGPRMCIGNRFALLEIKVALVTLLRRFNLVPTSKTHYPFEYSTQGFTIGPKEGFWFHLKPRNK